MNSSFTNFPDRVTAGEVLANCLVANDYYEPVIVTIPNGGVPVAVPLARRLALPLNLCLVAKVRFPLFKQVGIGAIDGNDMVTLNNDYIFALDVSDKVVLQSVEEARQALIERRHAIGDLVHLPDISRKTVIVVDDGIASGYTALAAVQLLQRLGPDRIVVAAPVSSVYAQHTLTQAGVESVCLILGDNPNFLVDDYYGDFEEVDFERVRSILDERLA